MALNEYRAFVVDSGDALKYAATTYARLVALAAEVRVAAGLKSRMFHLTSGDMIGPPTVHPG
jgi:hypothetical protein